MLKVKILKQIIVYLLINLTGFFKFLISFYLAPSKSLKNIKFLSTFVSNIAVISDSASKSFSLIQIDITKSFLSALFLRLAITDYSY